MKYPTHQNEHKAQAPIVDSLLKKTGDITFKNTTAKIYLKKGEAPSQKYEANAGKGV